VLSSNAIPRNMLLACNRATKIMKMRRKYTQILVYRERINYCGVWGRVVWSIMYENYDGCTEIKRNISPGFTVGWATAVFCRLCERTRRQYRTVNKVRDDSLAKTLQQNTCEKYFHILSLRDLIECTNCGKWLHETCVIYHTTCINCGREHVRPKKVKNRN